MLTLAYQSRYSTSQSFHTKVRKQALTNELFINVRSRTPVSRDLLVNLLPCENICTCSWSRKYLKCFPRKEKPVWNHVSFFFFFKKKKGNQTYLLINKGPSCLFEKINWKLRINFCKMAIKNICKFSQIRKLIKLR